MPVQLNTPSDQPTHVPDADVAPRSVTRALGNTVRGRCPSCGTGKLYDSYLKVTHTCGHCGTELHHQEADDAPAYMVMFIVGHIVIALVLMVEQTVTWPTWLHAVVWLPTILIMSLALLPPVKGALIGIQWAQRMHGFGARDEAA